MAQAVRITTTKISDLIIDHAVRAAFQRAERDSGLAFAIPAIRPRALGGGAAELVRIIEEVV